MDHSFHHLHRVAMSVATYESFQVLTGAAAAAQYDLIACIRVVSVHLNSSLLEGFIAIDDAPQ